MVGYLNGTRLPNWVWLVVGILGAGFIIGVNYGSQIITKADLKEQASIYEARDVARNDAMKEQIRALDSKVDRRTNRINEELSDIARVTRYVARKVE